MQNITIDFDDSVNLTSLEKEEIVKRLKKVEDVIVQNLPRYFDFVSSENKSGRYVEVHLPVFDADLTVMISKLKEEDAYLVSLLDHKNSKVFGNLIVPGYRCTSVKELKKYADWSSYKGTKSLKVFKLP